MRGMLQDALLVLLLRLASLPMDVVCAVVVGAFVGDCV